MDFAQFRGKFEEMEKDMGILSAYSNYQLETAIVWGCVFSLSVFPYGVYYLMSQLIDSLALQILSSVLIVICFLITAHCIFQRISQGLNQQFLENTSIFILLLLYGFPFCSLFVAFQASTFEALLKTCSTYVNISIIWTTSLILGLIFSIERHNIHHFELFMFNMITMDVSAILLATNQTKYLQEKSLLKYLLFGAGTIVFQVLVLILAEFNLQLLLSSVALLVVHFLLVLLHLDRQIYPLYGHTPILVFLSNKVLPFISNLLICILL